LAVAVTLVWPEALVVAGVVSVALAPDPGAANVTVAPGTRLPPESFTVTCSAVAKAVLMEADCVAPPVVVIDAAGPGVFVREKLALNPPAMLAVTV